MVEGLVSTIIPVHNRPKLLREAVASVLAQTYRPIEIIIVDDGSTDVTPTVIVELAVAHPEVRGLHQANAGPGVARETGRQAAQGEFIQYLDSDDLLLPRKFEWQVAALKQRSDCGVAYGKTRFYPMADGPSDAPWKRTGERVETMFPSFLLSRWWGTSTPLYRRSVLNAAGAWLALRNEEDWEYDCRIAASGTRLAYVDAFVSDQRWDGQERLSMGGTTDPAKLKDRAKAHTLIYRHACCAGIASSAPEMQHFARDLFLLSRQCGTAGLAAEAHQLFALARQASGPIRSQGLDFRVYHAAAIVLGWIMVGKLSVWLDKVRK